MVAVRNWRGTEEGNVLFLIGMELQFAMLKKFWRWTVVLIAQQWEFT